VYDVLRESKTFRSEVKDVNGTNVTLEVAVNYSIMRGKSSKMHTTHGMNYRDGYVTDQVLAAIKGSVSKYTYTEMLNEKRDMLESEIKDKIESSFSENYLKLYYADTKDLDLPKAIDDEIVAKEVQEQRNLRAEKLKAEAQSKSSAKVATANGDAESRKIKADAEAYEYEMKQKNLSDKMIKQQWIDKWDGKLGNGNVFGNGTMMYKNVSK
jgi:regulator of protease activity HflC (stomatin/prohibitin superfamily)